MWGQRVLRRFGMPAKVAFVSHSMFGSSRRPSALKMRAARDLFVQRHPDIPADGELQVRGNWIAASYYDDPNLIGAQFRPEVYIDTTDVHERYLHAIHGYSLFRGEVVGFRYEQWYEGASVMRGAESGFDHAVALMPYKTYYGSWKTVDLLTDGIGGGKERPV